MKQISMLMILMISSVMMNAQNTWVNKTAFPGAARFKSGAFSVDSKGYVVGGRTSTSPLTYTNDTWAYDPTSETWVQRANFPVNIVQPFSFSIGSFGYVVGGAGSNNQYQNSTYRYDPTANTWTARTNFPENAGGGFQFVIDGKAYVGGGARNSSMGASMYEYNPATDSYTAKSDYPGLPSVNQIGFAIGSVGFAGMGTNGQGVLNNEMYKYNPSTDTWSAIANFPGRERFGAVAFVLDGRAYVGGGARLISGSYFSLNDFYEYNPGTNSWSPAPGIPGLPKAESAVFTINSSAFIANGYEYDGNVYYNGLFEFTNCSNEVTFLPGIDAEESRQFALYPNPTSGSMQIELQGKWGNDLRYELVGIDGRLIQTNKLKGTSLTLATGSLPNGTYFIALTDGTDKRTVKKFEVIR